MRLNIQYLENYDLSWGELGYKHLGDAGFDLRAAITEPIVLKPGQFMPIPTGVKFELDLSSAPIGFNFEIQIRAR